jgi:hypothetical protein
LEIVVIRNPQPSLANAAGYRLDCNECLVVLNVAIAKRPLLIQHLPLEHKIKTPVVPHSPCERRNRLLRIDLDVKQTGPGQNDLHGDALHGATANGNS